MLNKLIDCAMVIAFTGLGILCISVSYLAIKHPDSLNYYTPCIRGFK